MLLKPAGFLKAASSAGGGATELTFTTQESTSNGTTHDLTISDFVSGNRVVIQPMWKGAATVSSVTIDPGGGNEIALTSRQNNNPGGSAPNLELWEGVFY